MSVEGFVSLLDGLLSLVGEELLIYQLTSGHGWCAFASVLLTRKWIIGLFDYSISIVGLLFLFYWWGMFEDIGVISVDGALGTPIFRQFFKKCADILVLGCVYPRSFGHEIFVFISSKWWWFWVLGLWDGLEIWKVMKLLECSWLKVVEKWIASYGCCMSRGLCKE